MELREGRFPIVHVVGSERSTDVDPFTVTYGPDELTFRVEFEYLFTSLNVR
jgi:hypothetical protein